ncbi:MAG: hypothetical protein HY657_07000 [Acidobacteria bacterium]|nr:hypothetical protein [Acidobacteriota bacterium]
MDASRTDAASANLRAALEATANALAQSNLDGLLAAEHALAQAFTGLSALRALDGAALASARDDLAAAQAALVRCRRLGAALGEFIRVSFAARGTGTNYDLAGAVANELNGRGLHMRA